MGQTKANFAVANKYISNDFIDQLYEWLSDLTLEGAFNIANKLDIAGGDVIDAKGKYVSLPDLICWYGPDAYADSVGPVHFYGGPELETEDKLPTYTYMSGTVLTYIMDCILLTVSLEGYAVLADLACTTQKPLKVSI